MSLKGATGRGNSEVQQEASGPLQDEATRRDIQTMIAAKDDRIRVLEAEMARREQALSAQIAGLKSTLTQVLGSKSWRLMEPLRWLYMRLRPHGTSESAAIQTA